MRSVEASLEALRAALPGAHAVFDSIGAEPRAWIVGGAVRDALLDRQPTELDVVVEGDTAGFISSLGGEVRVHDRFGTASVTLADGLRVDVVRSRAETYAEPGALPDVVPGTLEEDLRRRDVTVNALAARPDGTLRHVPGALEDLQQGVVRVLHDGSFADDPTRLWRVARYAARLGFRLDDQTKLLAALADPSTASGPRHGAELRKALIEPDPLLILRVTREVNDRLLPPAFTTAPSRLAEALGLLPPGEGRRDLVVLAACCAGVDAAVLVAWLDHLGFSSAERDVVAAGSRASTHMPLHAATTPSEIARAARGAPLEVVALAGGDHARAWIDELRHVRLRITGDDLIAAGIAPGPDLGRRLQAALDAKLDGRIADDRDEEFRTAVDSR